MTSGQCEGIGSITVHSREEGRCDWEPQRRPGLSQTLEVCSPEGAEGRWERGVGVREGGVPGQPKRQEERRQSTSPGSQGLRTSSPCPSLALSPFATQSSNYPLHQCGLWICALCPPHLLTVDSSLKSPKGPAHPQHWVKVPPHPA